MSSVFDTGMNPFVRLSAKWLIMLAYIVVASSRISERRAMLSS